ncbi:MAG: aminotransferase class V-fold PLP-dependent enzyme [Solirubrobacteraceae bacterium]
MEPAALRAAFPVVERLAYLNAGTDGPVPTGAVAAANAEVEREAREGRLRAHFERRFELIDRQRAAYAVLLACSPADVALSTCTSEGIATVVGGLDLRAGDEVVTSDQEHPGLLGALQAARDLRGVTITMAPFARVHEAVGPRTRLVATSHVSWVGGEVAPPELSELDEDVPVLLDGAQGVGAVPVDVGALGADAYAGAGQKWLCGPDGTGMLFVSQALRERLPTLRRTYLNFADAGAGLDAGLHPDARRFDTPSLPAESQAFALAAHDTLAGFGWKRVHDRATDLAATLAERLAEAGREVAPRGRSTLVSWSSEDPEGDRERLAQRGVAVRDIPGRGLLRASVGAWNDPSDLERLLDALGPR